MLSSRSQESLPDPALQLWGFSNNARRHGCGSLYFLVPPVTDGKSLLQFPFPDFSWFNNAPESKHRHPSLSLPGAQSISNHGITPDLALSSQHDVNFTCFIKQQRVESHSNAGHIKHVTHRAIKDCLKLSFKVQSSSCRKNETSVAQRIKLCIA